eukprot:10717286-Alexandrium_andersonii.AAC.1
MTGPIAAARTGLAVARRVRDGFGATRIDAAAIARQRVRRASDAFEATRSTAAVSARPRA